MRAMRTYASWAFAALVAMGAGCGDDAPSGASDSGVVDSGASDVGASDSGPRDAAPSDVGSDTGVMDAGHDAGVMDAGSDGGASDVNDAGTSDANVSDAGASDVATVDVTEEDAGEECVGRPAACVSGTAGGACGDALSPPECVAGEWRCPTGKIPVTECACVGRPPGMCTCGPSGWECDGGL